MKLNITLFGALPFRRISKTAKRQRRTHLKKTAPTVATCSNCGNVKKDLKLKDRVYICPVCGLTIDRDLNASINIMFEGLKLYMSEVYS